MNTSSIRKLSVLGIVLMAASAVTAAIMPKDKTDKTAANNNRLVPSTDRFGNENQVSCVTTASPVNECTFTEGTYTTTANNGNGTSTTALGGHTTAGGGTGADQNTSQDNL